MVTECINWTGCTNSQGYGQRKVSGKVQYTHRLAYIEAYGDIPEGLVVRHKCDNRLCMNPEHLEVGTQSDNMTDCLKRRRNPRVKLSDAQLRSIRKDTRPSEVVAEEYSVTGRTIRRVRKGTSHKHVED